MKKPVIFISDLHLGAGEANDFHFTFELHRLLDYAAEHASGLVLNGDILELLQSELTEVYLQHHELFMHLFDVARKIPVTYVIGNHDALVAMDYRPEAPSYFLGSPILVTPEYTNEALGVIALHGHQFDAWNSKEDILDISEGSTPGDRIATVLGHLERHVHPKLDNVLDKLYMNYKKTLRAISHDTLNYANLVTPAHPDFAKLGGTFEEYDAGVRDMLRSKKWDVCVIGHTHRQEIRRYPEGIMANTGSWVGDDRHLSPPTFVEASADIVRLIDADTFEVLAQEDRRASKSKYSRVTARVTSKITT